MYFISMLFRRTIQYFKVDTFSVFNKIFKNFNKIIIFFKKAFFYFIQVMHLRSRSLLFGLKMTHWFGIDAGHDTQRLKTQKKRENRQKTAKIGSSPYFISNSGVGY